MKISWYGQSCILLESSEGITVLCDPYDAAFGYRLPHVSPDIVTVSHRHSDHSAVDTVQGNPVVLQKTGLHEVKNITVKGIETWHDDAAGALRGNNISFRFFIDNIYFLHLGDIGHILTREQTASMRPCDILAVPVGGKFTVGSEKAFEIVRQLDPQIVIPVHYDTPSNRLGLEGVEDFAGKFPEIQRVKHWKGARKDLPKNLMLYILFALGENKS